MSEQEDADDDWFEQGLKEARQSSTEAAETADSSAAIDGAAESETESLEPTDDGETEPSEPTDDEETESFERTDDDKSDADSWMTEVTDDEPETTATDDEGPWTDPADASEAFETGTETADDDPFGTGETEGFGETMAQSSAESETQQPSSSWADSTDADSDGLFDDDGFASAFETAGAGDEDFSDDDFESDIPRLDLGIDGLDQMIQGGIPRRHLMVVIGSAGTGKTTFGLQFLHHGLQQGEKGVFITLEQSHEAIIATGNEWGWDFAEYEEKDMLAIVDLDPVEMANSLDNIQAELPKLIQDFGADRLVLDSVSLLEMMYDNVAKRRTEVFDFTRSLKKAGVTTFLTSEASETNPYASRHGIIEYLTDAVFVLRYIRGDMQETRLAVEIQKIRNANHSRETKPYDLTEEGISVYQQANIF